MPRAQWTLCPRCGSFDLQVDPMGIMGQQHRCKNCGYKGSFVIEADSREEALRIQEELRAQWEAETQDEDDSDNEDNEDA